MHWKRILLFTLITMVYAGQADAIPAFARKYNISCMTCHAPSAPKLKSFGDTFAEDGFKLEDYQSPRYYSETGDEKLNLLREFPIAVRFDGYMQTTVNDDSRFDFSAPYLLKLLSGGQIAEKLAFYFYFYMDERGKVAGVEDAFLMYDNLLNTGVDIYLGQFQVSDPLFKRELRLTFEDYHLYTTTIGISDINMAYDKGVMLTYSLPTSTDIVVEVVNGNGLNETNAMKLFDKDPYKNYLGRVSQSLGDFLSIGFVGYYGKEKLTNHEVGTPATINNEAIFVGSDISVSVTDKWELNGQLLQRKDSKVYTSWESIEPVHDILTQAVLGELIYSPKGDESDWYATALYNYIASDYSPADYHAVTLHAGYLLRRNVRLGLEFTEIITDMDNPHGRLSFGFVSAF